MLLLSHLVEMFLEVPAVIMRQVSYLTLKGLGDQLRAL